MCDVRRVAAKLRRGSMPSSAIMPPTLRQSIGVCAVRKTKRVPSHKRGKVGRLIRGLATKVEGRLAGRDDPSSGKSGAAAGGLVLPIGLHYSLRP